MKKQSRLVRKILEPGFKCHLKPGPKKCRRDDHLKPGQSGFRMLTVYIYVYSWIGFQKTFNKNLYFRRNFYYKMAGLASTKNNKINHSSKKNQTSKELQSWERFYDPDIFEQLLSLAQCSTVIWIKIGVQSRPFNPRVLPKIQIVVLLQSKIRH